MEKYKMQLFPADLAEARRKYKRQLNREARRKQRNTIISRRAQQKLAENTKKRVGKNKHGGTEKMEKYKIQLFPADLAEAAENTKKRVGKNKHGGTEKMEKYKIQLFPADFADLRAGRQLPAENTKYNSVKSNMDSPERKKMNDRR
jgi:hypothetical protein